MSLGILLIERTNFLDISSQEHAINLINRFHTYKVTLSLGVVFFG
jgi:hypothetical protein